MMANEEDSSTRLSGENTGIALKDTQWNCTGGYSQNRDYELCCWIYIPLVFLFGS